jgi:Polyketide cyclase / dehydrase and lipid transport
MKTFDVQGIELTVPCEHAFRFIADPQQLPRWTSAFASVTGSRAVMRTPSGEVQVGLVAHASAEHGTVDWSMRFPDGSIATAYSRVIPIASDRSVFSFVLSPPPVPLEVLEGTLDAQSRTLAEELRNLKRILEDNG